MGAVVAVAVVGVGGLWCVWGVTATALRYVLTACCGGGCCCWGCLLVCVFHLAVAEGRRGASVLASVAGSLSVPSCMGGCGSCCDGACDRLWLLCLRLYVGLLQWWCLQVECVAVLVDVRGPEVLVGYWYRCSLLVVWMYIKSCLVVASPRPPVYPLWPLPPQPPLLGRAQRSPGVLGSRAAVPELARGAVAWWWCCAACAGCGCAHIGCCCDAGWAVVLVFHGAVSGSYGGG